MQGHDFEERAAANARELWPQMQEYAANIRAQYEAEAQRWSLDNRDPVVGAFDAHNVWPYYEWLFRARADWSDAEVLDFGCGPGRNLVRYHDRFRRLDGVDISACNLEHARRWLALNGYDPTATTLYLCNGLDLETVPSGWYDLVMSTISLQHIPSHAVRLNYLYEFFRVLRPNGWLSVQMGYGRRANAVSYHDNCFNVGTVLGHGPDTRIDDWVDVRRDCDAVGFVDFDFIIGPTGPGDIHQHWIYWEARRPA